MDLSKYLKYLGLLVLFLLVFGSGFMVRDYSAQQDVENLLAIQQHQLLEIETTKTKHTNLTTALADSKAERSVLLEQIALLKSKPAEIRYITKIETVVEGESTVIVTELPASHTFRLKNGIAVAEFSSKENSTYEFDTADLTLKASVVIGERDSAISLRIQSDIEPEKEQEIEVQEFTVEHIREQKVFEPHILLGVNGNMAASAVGTTGPHIAVSLFHPRDEFDLVQVRAGYAGGSAQVGLDPLVYNVGTKMPVITNLWVGAGVSYSRAGPAGTISIGAKL